MNTASTAIRATAPKQMKKKVVSLDKKKARAGWIFVLPFVIGFVLIYGPRIAQSIISTLARL